MQASYIENSKVEAMAKEGLGERCPWFAKEAVVKPRDSLVASPGYAFVSADYSQVTLMCSFFLSSVSSALFAMALESQVYTLCSICSTLGQSIDRHRSIDGSVLAACSTECI